MLTAQDILKIEPFDAGQLFPGDAAEIKARFKKLAQEWHPDHNAEPDASAVFAHINKLRTLALQMKSGASANASLLVKEYDLGNGKLSRFKYLRAHKGDLGDILVANRSIAYEFPEDFFDVAEKEMQTVGAFSFADAAMKSEMARYLPALKRSLSLSDKRVLFYEKPEDCVLLADLAAYYGNKMPCVHVAWIVSSLMNMACYLGWAQRVHGAISMDNVLVCPAKHSIMLIGGWGYACPVDTRPSVLPRRTTSLAPRLAVAGELISPRVDLDLIKDIAQELLGAPGGAGLHFNKDVPDALKDWLVSPSTDNPISEYDAWMKALVAGYGKRRFVEMKVSPDMIYRNPN